MFVFIKSRVMTPKITGRCGVDKYPDLQEFLSKHWDPHYSDKLDENGMLHIELFDTNEVPPAFTMDNEHISITANWIIANLRAEISKILNETGYRTIIERVFMQYVGTVADHVSMHNLSRDTTLFLKEGLLVKGVTAKNIVERLIGSNMK